MLMRDHINLLGLTGKHPLVGPNLDSFEPGERFPSMLNAYDKELRELALSLAPKHKIELKQGVYVYLGGPSFETPAEVRFVFDIIKLFFSDNTALNHCSANSVHMCIYNSA